MKVLKGIISTLLATILVPIIMVFIVYLSTRSIVSKKGVNQVFNKIDFSDVLIDKNGNYTNFGNDIKNELVENGVPESIIDEVVDSKPVTDFFSEYAGDAINYIIYDTDLDNLKADDISKLINDNIDNIFEDLKERKVEGYEELTDERLEQIKSEVDRLSKGIEEKLPDVKKMVEDSDFSTSIKVVRIAFSNTMVMIFIVLISILSLLIVLLNLRKYSYGIWLGIIFIIASLPFIIISSIKTVVSTEVDVKALKELIKYVISKTTAQAFIFFVIGILFIVFTIIMRMVFKKPKNKDKKTKDIIEPIISTEEEKVITDNKIEPENLVVEDNNVENIVTKSAEISTEPVLGDAYYCAQCNAKMEPGQKFCYNCGASKE